MCTGRQVGIDPARAGWLDQHLAATPDVWSQPLFPVNDNHNSR